MQKTSVDDINYIVRSYVYKPAPGEIRGELPLPKSLEEHWYEKIIDARDYTFGEDILDQPMVLHEFYWYNEERNRLSLRFIYVEESKVQISHITYQDYKIIGCAESIGCTADEYDDWYAKHGQNTAPLEFCMIY